MSKIEERDLVYEYITKSRLLTEHYGKSLNPRKFYYELFNKGVDLQKRNGTADGKGNVIVVSKSEEENRRKRFTVHPDNVFEDLDFIDTGDFAFTSPISYFGKSRTLKNARFMYAMAIDIDDVGEEEMENIIYRIENGTDPRPTYIVNSGTGLHFYYKFEVPVPMYPKMQEALKVLKKELTRKVWNLYTSRDNKIQYQSINQGFRLVGGETKTLIILEDEITPMHGMVVAFRTGENITLDYLTNYIKWVDIDFTDIGKYGHSKFSLNEAKEKFPDWYQRRIVEKQNANQWICKRDLYDWWIEQIKAGAVEGHRYWCIYALTVYAVKCGISFEELKKDALSLQPFLNEKGLQPFTRKDINDAIKLYKDPLLASKFTRKYIEEQTAIVIPPNKRNGRTQAEHIKLMNFIRDEINHNENWREGNGRKPKKDIVQNWKMEHPDGKKIDCIRDTGLTKPTVYKWWNV